MARALKRKPPYSHHLSRNGSGATPYFSNYEIRLAAYFYIDDSAMRVNAYGAVFSTLMLAPSCHQDEEVRAQLAYGGTSDT